MCDCVNYNAIQQVLVWNLEPIEWVSSHWGLMCTHVRPSKPRMCNQRYVLLLLSNLLLLAFVRITLPPICTCELPFSQLKNTRICGRICVRLYDLSISILVGGDSASGFFQQECFLPCCLVVEGFTKGENYWKKFECISSDFCLQRWIRRSTLPYSVVALPTRVSSIQCLKFTVPGVYASVNSYMHRLLSCKWRILYTHNIGYVLKRMYHLHVCTCACFYLIYIVTWEVQYFLYLCPLVQGPYSFLGYLWRGLSKCELLCKQAASSMMHIMYANGWL